MVGKPYESLQNSLLGGKVPVNAFHALVRTVFAGSLLVTFGLELSTTIASLLTGQIPNNNDGLINSAGCT